MGGPDGSSRKEVLGDKCNSKEPKKALNQGVRWFVVVKKQGNACGAKEPW